VSIPTIIATPGSASANSFGTRAESDSYHATQLHPDAPWPPNVSATAVIGSGANGVITITVDSEGTEGNDYTVEVKLAATISAAMSAVLVGTTITVTLGTDGAGVADPTKNTALLITAAINLLTGLSATVSGTGVTVIPVTAETEFTGGSYIEELKNPALIMATQQMTALIEWEGCTSTATQALPFPRMGLMQRNRWASIPQDVVPNEVKYCQFELARLLLNADRTTESDVSAQGITSLKAGPIALTFKEDGPTPPVIPSVATDLLVPQWIIDIRGVPTGTRELERA
jgi:hypothetical protein